MRKRKIQKQKKKPTTNIKNSKIVAPQKLWVKKPIRYSPYLHLLIISSFRRNVFFTLTNSEGQTRYSMSAGQSGFAGQARIARLALITVTENFLQKIWNQGIHAVFLIFKNYSKHYRAVIKGIKSILEKKYSFKIISLTVKTQTVFNGCRRKKRRRR